jgi:hypothetical protein
MHEAAAVAPRPSHTPPTDRVTPMTLEKQGWITDGRVRIRRARPHGEPEAIGRIAFVGRDQHGAIYAVTATHVLEGLSTGGWVTGGGLRHRVHTGDVVRLSHDVCAVRIDGNAGDGSLSKLRPGTLEFGVPKKGASLAVFQSNKSELTWAKVDKRRASPPPWFSTRKVLGKGSSGAAAFWPGDSWQVAAVFVRSNGQVSEFEVPHLVSGE